MDIYNTTEYTPTLYFGGLHIATAILRLSSTINDYTYFWTILAVLKNEITSNDIPVVILTEVVDVNELSVLNKLVVSQFRLTTNCVTPAA